MSPKQLPIIYGNPQAPQTITKHIVPDQYFLQTPPQPYQLIQPVMQQIPIQSVPTSQSNSRIIINPQNAQIQRSPSFSIQNPGQMPQIQTSLNQNQIGNNHVQMIIPAMSAGQYRPTNPQQ